MSDQIFAIVIVAILVSGIVKIVRIKAGLPEREERAGRRSRGQAFLDAASTSGREQELQREVEDLRERIHVLERIATEGRGTRALADEIESLRSR